MHRLPARLRFVRLFTGTGSTGGLAAAPALAASLFAAFVVATLPCGLSLAPAAQARTARPIGPQDDLSEHFARCTHGRRWTCVVDGDTIWLHGDKIRLSDINAPETHQAQCDFEKRLGERATDRLVTLLNAGPFSLSREAAERDRDRHGRLLRVVSRDGRSLGATLESEGLAEHWRGWRRDWCAT